MKIGKKEFLDMYFTSMMEKNITYINLMDITELIKKIYSFNEFTTLKEALDINDLMGNDVFEHQFVKAYDEATGFVEFYVTKEDQKSIKDNLKDYYDLLKMAIDKKREDVTIGKKQLIDMIFTSMLEDDISSINIIDIPEILKIIYGSSEFSILKEVLDINGLSGDDVFNHPSTTSHDEQHGLVEFSIPEEEQNKIREEYKKYYDLLKIAKNKRAMAKYLEYITDGNASFSYDDPNGPYSLPYVGTPGNELETKLFTDGKVISSIVKKEPMPFSKTRIVEIEGATYTMMAQYQKDKIDAVEVRGTSNGDFYYMVQEAQNLLNGQECRYKTEIDEKPKTYKLIVN